jgi:hypothetical protein
MAGLERRFVGLLCVGVLGLLALAAAVNLIVDPYGIYGWVSMAGFNRDKTQASKRSSMAKHYIVERVHPATILIGTSRFEVGLNPESAAWPQDLRPVFNLATVGSTPYSMLRTLQDALAVSQPKLVIIGTSFIESLNRFAAQAKYSGARGPFDWEKRLRVSESGDLNTRMWNAQLEDTVSTLLSLDALSDSIATVYKQGNPNYGKLTPLGLSTVTEFASLVRTEGEFSLFAAKDREKVAGVVPLPSNFTFDLESIGQAVTVALRHGAQPIVVITPGHADELEIYQQAGAMGIYEAWREALTQIVTSFGARKITIWDFAGLTSYTSETIPSPGDTTTQLRWFWETNHFKPALGDLIITRILGGEPADFGDLVTPTTLAGLQAKMQEAQRSYAAAHPDSVARVSKFIAERLARLCSDSLARCTE